MPEWLLKILGINWKTTLAGLSSIGAIIAAIIAAVKARDFRAVFDNLPLLFTALSVVLTSLGLLAAKDKTVTGVGSQALLVDSTGTATNVEGEEVGRQSPIPPKAIV